MQLVRQRIAKVVIADHRRSGQPWFRYPLQAGNRRSALFLKLVHRLGDLTLDLGKGLFIGVTRAEPTTEKMSVNNVAESGIATRFFGDQLSDEVVETTDVDPTPVGVYVVIVVAYVRKVTTIIEDPYLQGSEVVGFHKSSASRIEVCKGNLNIGLILA